ncbi:MAG: hypothetical protein IT581_16930 [Verrucomicrobiales bacterium]|nr:hypothetical protein [Verrucomicrobiales bacterium]
MKSFLPSWLGCFAALLLPTGLHAGVAYPDPAGGWSYIYGANAGEDVFGGGSDFDALDGTWSHNNGSDQWDGSGIGGTFEAGVNAPGGAKVYQEGGVSYLRIQDTGDPRDYGYGDPGNRKVYFGHDISAHGAADNALDQGVTISFRARIPAPAKTSSPLDPLHRDGQNAAGPKPYPDAGDGYVTSDGGKGNFVIKQQTGGAFAFSLAVADDQGAGDPNSPKAGFTGLTMNEFSGNVISGNVNFGQGTGTNVLALDPTEWHEFWIVLRKDPANIGTHEALIYVDGSTEARFFKITAGNGDDYAGIGYLAMGSTATPQNSALDVDFFAMKTEATFPPGALANLPPELRDLTPARGARYAPAADGLRFSAVTQPPNSIAANGATLQLNGQDVTADLVAAGDLRNRSFTYSKLVANQFYSGSVIIADQTGRKSTNVLSFDTFVQGQTVQAEFTDYSVNPELTIPAGRYQLYLFAGSTSPQFVRAERVSGGTAGPVGGFSVPNTGTLDAAAIVPLTDAFGHPVILNSTGGSTAFHFLQLSPAASAPKEILAVPTSAPATGPYVAAVTPASGATGVIPNTPIQAEIANGAGQIDANSARLSFEGADVTAQSTSTPTASGLTLRYQGSNFLTGGSTPTAKISFSVGGQASESSWNFTVANVPTLKPSWATAASSVSGKPRGFTGRIHKARNDADDALFPNNPERALAQLAGTLIDPDSGQPFVNEGAGPNNDGSFVETDTINYEQSGIEKFLPGDRPFPNLDATDHNHIALEVRTYLDLPRGAHRLAVACDDGFVVWAGPSAAQATNQVGIRNPGGSTAEVSFDVVVESSGIYAFRLVYFEGNGGADVEWYSVNPETNDKTLINATGGIAAYQSRTGDGTDVVTPTTVSLTVAREAGSIVLSWPKTTPAYGLESSGALGSGSWTAVPGTVTDSGTTLSQRVTSSSGSAYYRLRSP